MISEAKSRYFEKIKQQMVENGTKYYFQAAKTFGCKDAPRPWHIKKMFPELNSQQIAEKAAVFFNGISQEFEPVRNPNKSITKTAPAIHEVASALKSCKKPKSKVQGDIDRRLVAKFSDMLAVPLHFIYCQVYSSLEWPDLWSQETVTLIPKNSNPDGLKQLRNLSCTPLFSKVLEGFILKSLKKK